MNWRSYGISGLPDENQLAFALLAPRSIALDHSMAFLVEE